MDSDENYPFFIKAFKHYFPEEIIEGKKKRDGKQKELHHKSGVSQSLLSMIASGERKGGRRTHEKIAKSVEHTYESFINFGKSLVMADVSESTLSADTVDCIVTKPETPSMNHSATNNVHAFPVVMKKPILSQEELAYQAMRDNLEIIIKSGDTEIVEAIKSNLIVFKRTVESAQREKAAQQREKMAEQRELEMLERIRRLEGAG